MFYSKNSYTKLRKNQFNDLKFKTMKKMKFIILLLGLFLISSGLFSQSISSDVISNSGENFVGNNASLNWTLGESVIDVLTCENYIHTQGFHQTYMLRTNILDNVFKSSVSVYPNPVKDFVYIKLKDNTEDVTIELYDLLGRKLHSEVINHMDVFMFNMKPYTAGKYLLQVVSDNKATFGIIKIDK